MVWSVLIVPSGIIENVRKCPWQSIIDFLILMMIGFAASVHCQVFQFLFFSSDSMDGSVENDSLIIIV